MAESPSSGDRAVAHSGETGSLRLGGFRSDVRRALLTVLGGAAEGTESPTPDGELYQQVKALGSADSTWSWGCLQGSPQNPEGPLDGRSWGKGPRASGQSSEGRESSRILREA